MKKLIIGFVILILSNIAFASHVIIFSPTCVNVPFAYGKCYFNKLDKIIFENVTLIQTQIGNDGQEKAVQHTKMDRLTPNEYIDISFDRSYFENNHLKSVNFTLQVNGTNLPGCQFSLSPTVFLGKPIINVVNTNHYLHCE